MFWRTLLRTSSPRLIHRPHRRVAAHVEWGLTNGPRLMATKADAILKTPKGTKDYNDKEMTIRNHIFSTLTDVFQKHGAVTMDTPVFELRHILASKYGEESKLIYDLADQGGESCSLRYDLTVPFARFMAMYSKDYPTMKRYHIAKVYRRDQPAMTKGRLREFYQCDFDIAGQYDPMLPDAEVLYVLCEALVALRMDPFTVKINHRQLLQGIFEVCGLPAEHTKSVSAVVDKLDKVPWEALRSDMVEKMGLEPSVVNSIGAYVNRKGDHTLLESLKNDTALAENAKAAQGMDELALLFDFLDAFDIRHRMTLDLGLARGLDYYTGIIYEAVTETDAAVGSIAAGGRYDDLVGSLAGVNSKGKPARRIPCVGMSVGVERVFSILMDRHQQDTIKSCATEVFVIAVGDALLKERMQLTKELWEAGIKASFLFKNKPKLDKQWTACEKDDIPFAVIVGSEELGHGKVRIKDMRARDESQGGGVLIRRSDMVKELQSRIARWQRDTSSLSL